MRRTSTGARIVAILPPDLYLFLRQPIQTVDALINLLIQLLDALLQTEADIFLTRLGLLVLLLQGKHFLHHFDDLIVGGLFAAVGKVNPADGELPDRFWINVQTTL